MARSTDGHYRRTGLKNIKLYYMADESDPFSKLVPTLFRLILNKHKSQTAAMQEFRGEV
ncbi:hypothetical protein GCM10028773_40310 [Spirosoma koreense]